jgi:hypothetical protein
MIFQKRCRHCRALTKTPPLAQLGRREARMGKVPMASPGMYGSIQRAKAIFKRK